MLVVCSFKPAYRHLSGSTKAAWQWQRGAWVVVNSFDNLTPTPNLCGTFPGHLFVAAVRAPRRGTRCNPRKLLQEWLDANPMRDESNCLDEVRYA